MAVRDAGVDDDERGLGRDRDEPLLERAAVEQDGMALATEQRRRLVEDPARHADRSQLGALARERELERLEHEVRNRTERKPDRDLERRRRREARPDRQVDADRSGEADRRPAEQVELGRDGLRVASPAPCSRAATVGGEGLAAPKRSETSDTKPSVGVASSEMPCWIATGSTSPPL